MSSKKHPTRKQRRHHRNQPHQQQVRSTVVEHSDDSPHSEHVRSGVDAMTMHDEVMQDTVADSMDPVSQEVDAANDDDADNALKIGQRLQRARQDIGLTLEDAARHMRLPWRLVQKLEKGDWRGIDSPIYLRGYLKSYAALLGMPPPRAIDDFTRIAAKPQPLVSTGGISHGRYMLQRYAVASTYLVITALIVIPVAVLGINGGLKSNLARTAPLDPVPINQIAGNNAQDDVDSPVMTGKQVDDIASAKSENSTLMASMAPVNLIDRDTDSSYSSPNTSPQPDTMKRANTAMAPGSQGLSIHLDGPSWVEVTDVSGNRLEYSLLTPGDHDYPTNRTIDVRLGNAGAAHVILDGKALDLDPYKRSNVAYFRINAQGVLVKPPGA